MYFKQVDLRSLIEEDLPVSVRAHFVPAVKRAYDLVAKLYEQNPFLKWQIGIDHRRELRRIAVEYELKKLIDTGRVPLKYCISPNAINNCRHLEFTTNQFIITASQVQHKRSIPRPAIFRNRLLSDQLSWDFTDGNVDLAEERYYLILTHGYENSFPEFVCLGAPDPAMKGRWISPHINLLKEPMVVNNLDEEVITEDTLVRFKEHVKEAVSNVQ